MQELGEQPGVREGPWQERDLVEAVESGGPQCSAFTWEAKRTGRKRGCG